MTTPDDKGLAIADVLERAADLITPEGAWRRGGYAANSHGSGVSPLNIEACSFCAVGAIARVLNQGPGAAESWIEAKGVRRLIGTRLPVAVWNDRLNHPAVLAKFRKAAAKARKQGI